MPEFVIDKGMQSFKKNYFVVMNLNRFFTLHYFANLNEFTDFFFFIFFFVFFFSNNKLKDLSINASIIGAFFCFQCQLKFCILQC